MRDVTEEADTDADTDCRYAGATFVSGLAVPLVTLVHPTIPITTAATQPSASAPRLGNSPTCLRPIARHPMSTVAEVTACRLRVARYTPSWRRLPARNPGAAR